MEAIREIEKKYCSRAITVAIVVSFALMIFALKPIARGLIMGTLFSIVNFIIIGETLPGRMADTAKRGALLAFRSIAFRYVLMAIPLIIAIKSDEFNLLAVVCGIFMVQMMILADQFSALISSKEAGKKALWKN